VQQLDLRCETKTLDNVFVTVSVSVHYCVVREQIYDAHYKLSNPKEQIRSYVYNVVRSTVPRIKIDAIFEEKDTIANAVKDELEKIMASYGYRIQNALITDIEPDSSVKTAMNQINAAQRMRIASADKAKAEKVIVVKAAEADAESKYLSGCGIARQRRAIVEGLRESVLAFSDSIPGATPKDVMDLVLVTQYFDTLKDIGSKSGSSTIFIPHSPSSVSDIASEVRNGFIQASASSASSSSSSSRARP